MKNAGTFMNRFRTGSNRSSKHDYSASASYFITISTQDMQHYLAEIVKMRQGASPQSILNDHCTNHTINSNQTSGLPLKTSLETSVLLSPVGQVAHDNWLAIPDHFPFVKLDAFQIMPNHLHGILHIEKEKKVQYEANQFKAKAGSLGTILGLFKGSVTKFANENNIVFKWKNGYHDIIIRDPSALVNMRNYISNNPLNWIEREKPNQKKSRSG